MGSPPEKKPRYRFGDFVVSPSRRVLLRGNGEIPLIPRYFDLLVLLIERRNEAVHRQAIFDNVWSDVVVSDGALSQAIRTLRRSLGDNPREPVYIRTISRHGYRFVFPEVMEEDDGAVLAVETPARSSPPDHAEGESAFEAALDCLLDGNEKDDTRLREASETLHALGTAEALRRLEGRAGHERARAYLRDTRWEVPGAGAVAIFRRPGALEVLRILAGIRLRRARRFAGSRWLSAVVGGALAGLVAGVLGGGMLRFGPGSTASDSVLVALPLVGSVIGGLAAAGVAAGLSAAETLARSLRTPALVVLGALGGGAVGAAAHLLGRLTLEGLFGRDLSPIAGGFEGLVIGGGVGLGYALSAPQAEGGMAAPRGRARVQTAVLTGLAGALAGALLGWTGGHLGAMSLDFMAQTFPGSQVGLTPLARLLGEPSAGVVTRTVISAWEGFMFGLGLSLGLTRRPR